VRRPLFAAALLALLALVGLWFVPPAGLLVLYLFGPAVTAWLATRPGADRNRYSGAGVLAAVAVALVGAIWVATHPEDTHPFSIIASFIATFAVVSIVSALVVVLVSNRFPKPGAGDEEPG
jgi:biotin transporter BioY